MTNENFKKGDRTVGETKDNSLDAEIQNFDKYITEPLESPWHQCMVQKDKEGFSSISYQKPVDDRPLNVVRTQSVMKDMDIEMYYQLFF